jgi:hypothetical protein
MNHTLESLSKLSGTDFYINTEGLGTTDMVVLYNILRGNGFKALGGLVYGSIGILCYSDNTFNTTDKELCEVNCKAIEANDLLDAYHESSYLAQKHDQKPQAIYADTVLPVNHPDYDRIMVHALD